MFGGGRRGRTGNVSARGAWQVPRAARSTRTLGIAMNCWLTLVAMLLVVISAPSSGDELPDTIAPDAIIFADSYRNAFYTAATRSVADSMRTALDVACRTIRQATNVGNNGTGQRAEPWPCDGRPLTFLVAVDVLGHRSTAGHVCVADLSPPQIKYYVDDMLDDCVRISYDDDTGTHGVDTEDLLK